MEESTEFQDWELLNSPDIALISTPYSPDNSKALEAIEGDSEGAIKPDYFSLDSQTRRIIFEEGSEEVGLVEPGSPSWIDSVSDHTKPELGSAEIEGSGTFLPDESSDCPRTPSDHGKGGLVHAGDSEVEVGFEGIVSEHQEFGVEDVGKEVDLGGVGENEVIETGCEEQDGGSDSLAEMSTENGGSENLSVGAGGKREIVWWKLPLELLKFCAFRVRPVWSISIAAAIMGFIMLGRKLYKMKHKSRSIPLKVSFDDKKASQFMVRAARLNEAFSVVRRAPIIRSPLPAAGVTPWPVVGLR